MASRKDWQSHVAKEGPRVYKRMYCLTIYHFIDLFRRIENHIKTDNEEMAVQRSGSPVCAEVRLGMTLLYLASGQVWDIKSNFGVSASEFYRSA